MVTKAPMPAGTSTPKSRLPMPSTRGVYRPRGISKVEKLMPGAMMDSAMQNPQNRYQPKLGAMVTDSTFKESSSASTTAKAATRLIQLPRVWPCSPASRKREGSMPAISPTNRHTLWSG